MIPLWLAVALAGIRVTTPDADPPHIYVGRAATITVTDDAGHPLPGQTVRVVHRPGLAQEQEQAIGITDALGQVGWSPVAAGVARIRAGDAWQPVHVDGPVPVATVAAALALLLASMASVAWGVRSGARIAR